MTEGKTDAEFSKGALDTVAPAVSHMFRFFDADTRSEGGADAAVRTILSFAAAGVANRVVAVFDNDTAGMKAARTLSTRALPSNVRFLLLPRVEYVSAYPTLGPSGSGADDLNGTAAANEFQFGLSALTDANGELIPVRWTGFDRSLNAYGVSSPRSRLCRRISALS